MHPPTSRYRELIQFNQQVQYLSDGKIFSLDKEKPKAFLRMAILDLLRLVLEWGCNRTYVECWSFSIFNGGTALLALCLVKC